MGTSAVLTVALIGKLYQKTLDFLARKKVQTAKELFDEMKRIESLGELDFNFFFKSVLVFMQENKRIEILFPTITLGTSGLERQEEALICLVSQQPH